MQFQYTQFKKEHIQLFRQFLLLYYFKKYPFLADITITLSTKLVNVSSLLHFLLYIKNIYFFKLVHRMFNLEQVNQI